MNEINKLPEQSYTTQPLGIANESLPDGFTSEVLSPDQEQTPPSAWMIIRELTETIVLSLIIFLLMRQVVQNYRIESHSMEPNFIEGQFILVNKLAYVFGEPNRGDVLVFHNPNNNKEDYQFKAPVTGWDESSSYAHWRNRAAGQAFFAVINFTETHESSLFPKKGKQGEPRLKAEEVEVPPYLPDLPEVRSDTLDLISFSFFSTIRKSPSMAFRVTNAVRSVSTGCLPGMGRLL